MRLELRLLDHFHKFTLVPKYHTIKIEDRSSNLSISPEPKVSTSEDFNKQYSEPSGTLLYYYHIL